MNRRQLLYSGAAFTLSSLSACVANNQSRLSGTDSNANTSKLAIQRARQIEPSTIGAFVGAALGIAVFVAATRSAPRSLLGAFGFAVVGGLIGRRIVIASQEYVDYKYELAERRLERTSELVRLDAESDARHFMRLDAQIAELRTLLVRYQSSSSSLSETRSIALALRDEVSTLKEEQNRSRSSVPFFDSVHRQIDRKSFGSGTSAAIDKSAQYAKSYANSCEQLELEIFKIL